MLLPGRQKGVSPWNPPRSLGPSGLVFSKSILRHANYGSRDQDQTPRTTLQGTLDLAGTFRSGSDQGELSRRLWEGDTFVDFEHSLATAISKIREALGDSADSPRYAETLPRRGYRFIAEATVVSGGSVNKLAPAAGDPPPAKDHDQIEVVGKTVVSKRPPWRLASKTSVLVLALLLATLLVWIFRPGSRSSANPPLPSPIRSLAVLPLESLSSDASQDYFADGLTDELIADLGQISALRVISRTSIMQYKGARKHLPQIARELNVDAVVEGTVLRAGQKVRIGLPSDGTLSLRVSSMDTVWFSSFLLRMP